MIIEVGTTAGYAAQLLSVKIIKSLVTIILDDTLDSSGLLEEITLNEISILTGGNQMAELLRTADKEESRKHIYIVAETEKDAAAMEDALLYWVREPEQLKAALKLIDPDFNTPAWEGFHFESIAEDISDVLAASTHFAPWEVLSKKCYRGATSWLEM